MPVLLFLARNIMRRIFLMAFAAAALSAGWSGGSPPAVGQVPEGSPAYIVNPVADGPHRRGMDSHFADFNTVVRGAKEYDGLFKLHQKDDHLYAEIRPNQLGVPILCPIAVARGGGMGGFTLNFEEQWVLIF